MSTMASVKSVVSILAMAGFLASSVNVKGIRLMKMDNQNQQLTNEKDASTGDFFWDMPEPSKEEEAIEATTKPITEQTDTVGLGAYLGESVQAIEAYKSAFNTWRFRYRGASWQQKTKELVPVTSVFLTKATDQLRKAAHQLQDLEKKSNEARKIIRAQLPFAYLTSFIILKMRGCGKNSQTCSKNAAQSYWNCRGLCHGTAERLFFAATEKVDHNEIDTYCHMRKFVGGPNQDIDDPKNKSQGVRPETRIKAIEKVVGNDIDIEKNIFQTPESCQYGTVDECLQSLKPALYKNAVDKLEVGQELVVRVFIMWKEVSAHSFFIGVTKTDKEQVRYFYAESWLNQGFVQESLLESSPEGEPNSEKLIEKLKKWMSFGNDDFPVKEFRKVEWVQMVKDADGKVLSLKDFYAPGKMFVVEGREERGQLSKLKWEWKYCLYLNGLPFSQSLTNLVLLSLCLLVIILVGIPALSKALW